MFQAVGNLFQLSVRVCRCRNDRFYGDSFGRLCRKDSRLPCGNRIKFHLFGVKSCRLRIAHNAVFFGNVAPLKMTLPLVAAFRDISVLRKRAVLTLGGVLTEHSKVNPAFPFFGHLYRPRFVQIVVAKLPRRMRFGNVNKKVGVVGKVNDLPDVLKAHFALQSGIELFDLCGVKLGKTRRKKIKLVNVCRTNKIVRQSYVILFVVYIPANEKVLRVICRNPDAFHSRV